MAQSSPNWSPRWRSATIYQYRRRSWRDANGDGVGDLAGVCERLDYLRWLGIDGIWLSLTHAVGQLGLGLRRLRLLRRTPGAGHAGRPRPAHCRGRPTRRSGNDAGPVPNHTSDAHAWFVDALTWPGAEHRDFYVAAPQADGGPPNNWLCATGARRGPSSPKVASTTCTLLPTQPDLNRRHLPWTRSSKTSCNSGSARYRRLPYRCGRWPVQRRRAAGQPSFLAMMIPSSGGETAARRTAPIAPSSTTLYRRWREIADGHEVQPPCWARHGVRLPALRGRSWPGRPNCT